MNKCFKNKFAKLQALLIFNLVLIASFLILFSNYVERRKKNNEAAKRSRDARRAKEDEVSIRAAFLEQENIQLKWDVTKLRADVAKIRAYVIAEAALEFQLQQQMQQRMEEKQSDALE